MTRERGQATVLALGFALVAFAVSGLAVDGTRAFLARRALQNLADGASLAAAGELDRTRYYGSGGRRVELDEGSARRIAAEWLAGRGVQGEAAVTVDRSGVVVVLRTRVRASFLSLVGIRAIPVAVESLARPGPGPPGP